MSEIDGKIFQALNMLDTQEKLVEEIIRTTSVSGITIHPGGREIELRFKGTHAMFSFYKDDLLDHIQDYKYELFDGEGKIQVTIIVVVRGEIGGFFAPPGDKHVSTYSVSFDV